MPTSSYEYAVIRVMPRVERHATHHAANAEECDGHGRLSSLPLRSLRSLRFTPAALAVGAHG